MRARCGIPFVDNVDSSAWEYNTAGFVDFDGSRPQDLFLDELHGVPQGVLTGLATARRGSKTFVEVVYVLPKLTLDAPRSSRDQGLLWVSGSRDVDDAWRRAYITRGDVDAVECPLVTAPKARAFEFQCPMEGADSSALVELMLGRTDEPFGDVVARVWVSPDGTEPTSYSAAAFERVLGASGAAPLSDVVASLARVWAPTERINTDDATVQLFSHVVDSEPRLRRRARNALLSGSVMPAAVEGALAHFFVVHEASSGLEALAGMWMFPVARRAILAGSSTTPLAAPLAGNRHGVVVLSM